MKERGLGAGVGWQGLGGQRKAPVIGRLPTTRSVYVQRWGRVAGQMVFSCRSF